MKHKILILLLSITLFSFKEKEYLDLNIIENLIIPSKEIITNLEKKHCFVKNIITKNGKNYIIVDYVDFLTGNKAIEKAKINGDAEYDVSKSGDTIYFVYNDYYISNVNSKLRTIELAENIKIELLDFSENANDTGYKNVSIAKFVEQYENHSLVILKLENGICKEIKEQFTP